MVYRIIFLLDNRLPSREMDQSLGQKKKFTQKNQESSASKFKV